MPSPLAAIDLGTNTARLLIGEREGEGEGARSLKPLLVKRRITRMGGGFSKEAGLSPEAMARNLEVLSEFAQDLKAYSVTGMRAVATSAVRDAVNGREFREIARTATGIELDVIGGEEEGLLTLRGVQAGLGWPRTDLFVFDVGGGSTEYTLSSGEVSVFTRSLPIGVVRLTEGFGTVQAMERKIMRELSVLEEQISSSKLLPSDRFTLVGTAGTATTLAAICMGMTEYDYRKVNNYELSLAQARAIYEKLLPLTPAERLTVPGLEKGREDLIIAGTLVLLKTMETFGFSTLKVSDSGLLEGVFLSI